MRLSVLVLFASLPLGACASVGTNYSTVWRDNPPQGEYASIAEHPTPELINESQRDIDIMRNEMVMDNINERMLNGDIRRFWLRDHPSRLSPFPITYTSGMPR